MERNNLRRTRSGRMMASNLSSLTCTPVPLLSPEGSKHLALLAHAHCCPGREQGQERARQQWVQMEKSNAIHTEATLV